MASVLYFTKEEFIDDWYVLFTTNTNDQYRFYDLHGFTDKYGKDINNENLQYNLMFAFMLHTS